MELSICIATFGDPQWHELALARALPSAARQADCEIVTEHGASLHEARNRAAERARGEWLVFLDADDELADGYAAAILAASGDLRAPAVSWVAPDGTASPPTLLDDRHIERMNSCVIGTGIRRSMFLDIGGFGSWPAWEDWALFLRAYRSGATIEHVPAAVYRAHVRPGSRNQTVANPHRLARQIRAAS